MEGTADESLVNWGKSREYIMRVHPDECKCILWGNDGARLTALLELCSCKFGMHPIMNRHTIG